jgi:7-keto-8-aminopelargonate synthetase-like enzyme
LITDSVDPLNATVTDFSFLKKASLAKRICCIIDDSHGIGLLGERGEGISLSLPQLDRVNWMLSYSLSKAFNINGGAISCSKKTATLLRRSPFYTASTSISPALCYAFKNGQSIYQQKREQLKRSIVTLQLLLKNKQVRFHPELPIFVLPQKFDQDYFYRHNIIISSFPYPDPAGEKISRLIVNALHTTKDLKVVAEILNAEASEVLL